MSQSHLNDLIARRWSPREFLDKPIEPEKLRSLFEAARWAASSFNEQPWRFVVATKDHPAEFERVLSTLAPKNQLWAKTAWALGISAARKTFTHSGAPNRFGIHDAGAALANLMLQAVSVGLYAHGMAGFDAEKARAEFGIPLDFEVGAAFAIGYIAPGTPPPATRTRRPLEETVFGTKFGEQLNWA
ncbi:MAG TPA: nitroreductase family protein [Bryobacteraceae bacterium]|nr:nitroreductase family protein [Bryobacteraceae bacterium]